MFVEIETCRAFGNMFAATSAQVGVPEPLRGHPVAVPLQLGRVLANAPALVRQVDLVRVAILTKQELVLNHDYDNNYPNVSG